MQGNSSAAPAGMIIYSDSCVHGNRTLYAEDRSYYYQTVVSGFSSSLGSRGRDLGGIANYYNVLLYNAAATSAALLLYALYELLAILFLCFKTRRKMLVFDRPSFSPLFWFLNFSPLYTTSPFHLIQVHKCLVADVRLAGMLYTHLCFISPFCFA